jgi:asparagine synthase (glutamine-hydrolysing)
VESSPELGRAGRFAFRHALLRDQRVGLPSLLRYEDRNAMEHSIEGRLPFVSAPLVELTLSLPDDHFIGPEGTTKWILREAMRGLVPDSVLDRRDRVGFDVPVRSWTRLAPGFAPALHEVAALPPVDATAVARLEAAIARGPSQAEAFAAWRLVGLGAWAGAMAVEWE